MNSILKLLRRQSFPQSITFLALLTDSSIHSVRMCLNWVMGGSAQGRVGGGGEKQSFRPSSTHMLKQKLGVDL